MKNQILRLRSWFEQLSLRERALFALLVWAVAYALFSLIFLMPVNKQLADHLDNIKKAQSQINTLDLQIDAVDKIPNSALYLEWQKQHAIYEKIQKQYQTLLGNFSSNNWLQIIKSVIASHPNMTLSHIENSQETPFAAGSAFISQTILQQSLTVVVYGDYFSFINYLEHIEKLLPNVRWDTLEYEVVTYPTAKITMEFTVFYVNPLKS